MNDLGHQNIVYQEIASIMKDKQKSLLDELFKEKEITKWTDKRDRLVNYTQKLDLPLLRFSQSFL